MVVGLRRGRQIYMVYINLNIIVNVNFAIIITSGETSVNTFFQILFSFFKICVLTYFTVHDRMRKFFE